MYSRHTIAEFMLTSTLAGRLSTVTGSLMLCLMLHWDYVEGQYEDLMRNGTLLWKGYNVLFVSHAVLQFLAETTSQQSLCHL
jgi:hypothetical protein